jgi:ComF family protein
MPEPVNRNAARAVDDGWLARLGHVLCPPRCLVCREPGAAQRDLCRDCMGALPWNQSACGRCAIPLPAMASGHEDADGGGAVCGACLQRPPPLDAVHAAFVYAFPLDRLLPRFKFHRDLAAGRLLAQGMADAFRELPPPDALVPVPLHRARLRTRGYDQALELAKPLAQTLGIPLHERALSRIRHTSAQSELDARGRRRNVRGAFAVDARAALPAHVVLVDDVMTTGATLHAAAVALRRAGVARVDAWVCARVP